MLVCTMKLDDGFCCAGFSLSSGSPQKKAQLYDEKRVKMFNSRCSWAVNDFKTSMTIPLRGKSNFVETKTKIQLSRP